MPITPSTDPDWRLSRIRLLPQVMTPRRRRGSSRCCLTYPLERTEHTFPALSPACVLPPQVPFGQAPSLHRLRRCSRIIVRQLRRYHGPVRLPVSVHRRRASSDFPTRPVCNSLAGRHRTSRFPSKVFPDVHGVCDRAGSDGISRWRYHRCCLPLLLTASAPRSKVLSRLNTRPVRTPVNASAPLLRTAPHDSGPVWIASPSLYDSFIHNTSPV